MLQNRTILLPIGTRVETYLVYQTDLQAQPVISRCRHALGSLKYLPRSPGLDPDLCPRTNTGSLGPCWDKEEQIESMLVPLTPEIMVSRNSHFSFNGQSYPGHRVPSSHVCRRMMCLKPMEVSCPSLAHRCTSSCNGSNHSTRLRNDGNCNAHSLYKGPWVKNRWWLDIALQTTSTSSSSTFHLHMSNNKLRFIFPYFVSGV